MWMPAPAFERPEQESVAESKMEPGSKMEPDAVSVEGEVSQLAEELAEESALAQASVERAARGEQPFGLVTNVPGRGHRTPRRRLPMPAWREGKPKTGSRESGDSPLIHPRSLRYPEHQSWMSGQNENRAKSCRQGTDRR